MAAKNVAFKRLLLRGFGPYRNEVEVRFSPGVNNLVTENERGKSTLVAGLIALLYGLPAKSNPAEFGLACYRNWENPSCCEGELEFTVNEERFLLARDFETNRIMLCRLNPEGKSVLAEGTHNPLAKRAHPDYENKLKELLGINSRDLFESVFCIIQPFPEMKTLSSEVQKLLSGGGADFKKVLEALEEELKTYTRFTGDLGITSRNLHKDKELETLEAEIDLLRRRIEEERQSVDSLEELQKHLGEIELQLEKARQEGQQKRRILEAWGDWKRRRDNYDSALREYNALSRSCLEGEKIKEELEARLKLLREEYAEWEEAAEKTAKNLEELALLEEKKKELKETLEELEGLLLKNREEKERLIAELSSFPGWEKLGGDPLGRVEDLQKKVALLKKELERIQGDLAALQEKQNLLETEYSIFQKASPGELEAIRTYAGRLAHLQQGARKAQKELDEARAQRENYEKDLKIFKEKFRELLEGEIPAEEIVAQKLGALEQENKYLDKKVLLQKKLLPSWKLRFILAFLFALLAAAAFASAGSFDPFSLAAFAAGAAILAGFFLAAFVNRILNPQVKKELKETEEMLSSLQEKIASLDREMGSFAAASPARLGSLLERIRQYKEEKTKLEEIRQKIPSEEQISALEKECRKRAEELQEFIDLTSKFISCFPDVEEAYARWQKLRDEKESLAQKISAYARDSFGCEPEKISAVNPLALGENNPWGETAFFLQILFPERELTTVEKLAAFLESIGTQTWEELKEKGQKYAGALNRLKELEAASDTLEKNKKAQNDRLLALQEKSAAYEKRLLPILEKTGGDLYLARERWRAFENIRHEIEIIKGKLNTILNQFKVESLEKLKEKELELQLIFKKRLEEWEELIEKYPGLPGIKESRDAEKIAARIAGLEEEAEQIERHTKKLQEKQEDLRTKLLLLKRQEPLNIAQAEIELKALEEKKKELELLRDALIRAHRELSAAIVDYQNSYLQHLQQAASEYYRQITGNSSRKILFDQDFQLRLEEDGRPCEIAQLSKGAQDQLYLALRLAIADLIADNIRLPFIFDDPFVTSDGRRLENIRHILEGSSPQRQYAVFSHNPVFSRWGTAVEIKLGKKGA